MLALFYQRLTSHHNPYFFYLLYPFVLMLVFCIVSLPQISLLPDFASSFLFIIYYSYFHCTISPFFSSSQSLLGKWMCSLSYCCWILVDVIITFALTFACNFALTFAFLETKIIVNVIITFALTFTFLKSNLLCLLKTF